MFALEVPYQDDLVPKAVLPALVGAATGYVAFVSIKGTEPLIPVAGNPPIGATVFPTLATPLTATCPLILQLPPLLKLTQYVPLF